ncbi:MAG: hypothetical protein RL557_289 [archaeon]|jgi:hypothetical protein
MLIQECLDQNLILLGSQLEITLFEQVYPHRGGTPHSIYYLKRGGPSDRGGRHVIGYIIGHNEDRITLSPTIDPRCSEGTEQEFPLGIYHIEHEAIHSFELVRPVKTSTRS